MWEMTPDSVPEGMVMVYGEAITPSETVDFVIVYLVPGHPSMHSDVGFIELVSRVIITFPANSALDLIMVIHSLIFTSEPPICRC
jgi:hypothetical protein